MRTPAAFTSALVALACAGCAVGPDYRQPQTATPDEWHSVHNAIGDPAALADWWKTLDDPTLNQLVEQALANNKTAKQAYARVVESRARRGIAAGDFWPTLTAAAGGNRTTSDSRTSDPDIGLSGGTDEIYSAGLDSGWELDLFGGKRRAFEAANAQLGASEADLRDVLVTLLGDVALSYVDMRTAQSRLTFAEKNLEAQRGVLDITQWRAAAGLATSLDVEQAQSNYQQTRAAIPSLQTSLVQSMNRLAVLTGEPPGSLATVLAERKPIPVASLEIAAGVPVDVLRRRPDIRSAERRLAAQTAEVGVATAALYPSLSLSGSITLQSLTASDVLDGFRTDRLGLSLAMPLFRGGALRQNVKAQNALVDQALASYEETVLSAYEEVENALTASSNENSRHEALRQGVESARRASELALTQYNSGLVDFQTVLDADRQLLALEDSLAVSDGEMTANLVRLYKALGGGWSAFPKE
ncbi:MAG TPA: efflux transporter outer membrane subunit [Steroidobacteraceae bacterium]